MDRIERMLWKINFKLDVLLEKAQPGLREETRQAIVDILNPAPSGSGEKEKE